MNAHDDPLADLLAVGYPTRLTTRAEDALTTAAELSGDSIADTLNRAVITYVLIFTAANRGGGTVKLTGPGHEPIEVLAWHQQPVRWPWPWRRNRS